MSYYAYRRPPETILPAGVRESGAEQGPIPEHLLPAKTEAERRERQREAELLREREKRFGKMLPRAPAPKTAAKQASPGRPVTAKVEPPAEQPAIEADVGIRLDLGALSEMPAEQSAAVLEGVGKVVAASAQPAPVARVESSPPPSRVREPTAQAVFDVTLPRSVRASFRAECRRRKVSMSSVIRAAIVAWLDDLDGGGEVEQFGPRAESPERQECERCEACAGRGRRHPLAILADEARGMGGYLSRGIPEQRAGEAPEDFALRVVERLYAIGARARGRELARKIGEWRRRG